MRKYFLVMFFLMFVDPVFAENYKLGFTAGNLWIGARYEIYQNITAEFRKGLEPDIDILNLRGYYSIHKEKKSIVFTGLEIGTINFNAEGISGNGNSVAPFIGIEFKIAKDLCLILDMEYSIITLQSQGYSVSGPEWIAGFGVNYYLKMK